MNDQWLDDQIERLRLERSAPPELPLAPLWDVLRPAVARRARQRRAVGAVLVTVFGFFAFGVGWFVGNGRTQSTSIAQDAFMLTPSLEVQRAGASFVTRLAALRGEVERGAANEAVLQEARVVAMSLVTGATAEIARMGAAPELTEILRLTTEARQRWATDLERSYAP